MVTPSKSRLWISDILPERLHKHAAQSADSQTVPPTFPEVLKVSPLTQCCESAALFLESTLVYKRIAALKILTDVKSVINE